MQRNDAVVGHSESPLVVGAAPEPRATNRLQKFCVVGNKWIVNLKRHTFSPSFTEGQWNQVVSQIQIMDRYCTKPEMSAADLREFQRIYKSYYDGVASLLDGHVYKDLQRPSESVR